MKFEFKQPSEFLVKDAWIWQSNMSGLGERKMNISRFFQYKCIRNQIWPCRIKDQGQPRFIICANLVGPTSPIPSPKAIGPLGQE